MKILVTGAKGQLGNKIIELFNNKHQLVLTDSDDMDITDEIATEKRILLENPDFIIHAAAYTKVDKAQEEQELVYKINALGSKNVAKAARKIDTTLLYISTDYVYNSPKHKPIDENEHINPINYYGESKLAGEKFIQEICDNYYIIRTAWLYGELPKGHPGSNFVETMIRLAKEKDEVRVVDDQVGSPTYTGDLIRAIDQIIETKPSFGIYNVSGEGATTWYKFAKEIFSLENIKTKLIPIATNQYPTLAKRPAYSYLSKEKLERAGISVGPWQKGLEEYLLRRNK